jgi:gas vesicle protein
MSSGKVLLGVLAGVAIGALAGILFAPDKGAVTRKKITKKSDEYADALREKFDEFLDTLSEKFEEVKEGVNDFTERKQTDPEEAKKNVKTAKS